MNTDIGHRLKQLRLENHYTQKEIAAILGVTPKAISFYELGQREAPYQQLLKLADRYNVSIDYILTGKTKTKPVSYILSDDSKSCFIQEIGDNPDLKTLLTVCRNLSPQTLKEILHFAEFKKIQEKNL